MLSNPYVESSAGSALTSASTASRSRTALRYSVRFIRCSSGRPGLGRANAAASSVVSSQDAKALYAAPAGRGRPTGGMVLLRSFCTTFSHSSGWAATCSAETSTSSRTRPAVRRPPLWQVTQ